MPVPRQLNEDFALLGEHRLDLVSVEAQSHERTASAAERGAAGGTMAFFQRVMSYLLNEVLVNGLANSRAFQKFAIRSSTLAEEAAKKTAQSKQQLGEHGSEFFKVFREEMTKGLKEINSKSVK